VLNQEIKVAVDSILEIYRISNNYYNYFACAIHSSCECFLYSSSIFIYQPWHNYFS